MIIWDNAAMRTTIHLDGKLIAKATKRMGARTKSEEVRTALKALVNGPSANSTATAVLGKSRPNDSAALAMYGIGAINSDYDPKAVHGDRLA